VEEIDEHVASGKPALIYFSSAPVLPESVDRDQYDAMVAFKDACRQRGLVEEYEDLAAFRQKMARHLAQAVIHHFAGSSATAQDSLEVTIPSPSVSDAARELLLTAAGDPRGTLMKLETLGGTHVQAAEREFTILGDARSEAKWRAAVDELVLLGLVEDRTGKGELYFVTDLGYVAADRMGGVDAA
jgi:hypothetical protein